jgi:hypothetical protein
MAVCQSDCCRNFDTLWRFSKDNETCPQFTASPGSLAIEILPQQIHMPNPDFVGEKSG